MAAENDEEVEIERAKKYKVDSLISLRNDLKAKYEAQLREIENMERELQELAEQIAAEKIAETQVLEQISAEDQRLGELKELVAAKEDSVKQLKAEKERKITEREKAKKLDPKDECEKLHAQIKVSQNTLEKLDQEDLDRKESDVKTRHEWAQEAEADQSGRSSGEKKRRGYTPS